MSALEAEMPLVKSMVAGHVARGVAKGLISLSDVAGALPQGQHYPLFLLVLQQLARTQGRPWLTQGLAQAKVALECVKHRTQAQIDAGPPPPDVIDPIRNQVHRHRTFLVGSHNHTTMEDYSFRECHPFEYEVWGNLVGW
ncbi:hypothetical protein HPB52_001524 [Rhipicephalus sanguineus]|uniref:Uncharacterized protein n=1 Tax=Rhipicephalus sanguineus TaxID=34632 RepID=A0A9D4Q6M0_RHISA|nr:hypothetical protein HPB52_001524 [Rhipicephalus sanguineus]